MPFEKALNHLFEQPFGPYLEETILSDKCKFMASKRLLLRDFQLSYNDEPTGFDRTEFEGDLTPPNVTHLAPIPSGSRVLFRGVLSLPAFAHLSEEGLKYLNNDFQERVTRSNVNGVVAAKRYSTLDLEDIFALNAKQRDAPEAEKYNISVLIQGYMHSTASFMRSDLAPNGLLFHSANAAKTKFRIYQIVSMDVETYHLSRTFLFRHHTLKTMRDILNRAASDGIPAHKCTPSWFLEQYFTYHAYPSRSTWQRINFLEGVDSADEGSDIHPEHPPDAQTHRPRHLRTVHKNEVWSIFASHLEWILSLVEKHKDLKSKVNSQSWRNFLMHVPQLRQEALLNQDTDGRWGLKDEQGHQMEKEPIPNTLFPASEAAVSQPTILKEKKPNKKKPSSKTKPCISVTTLSTFSSRSPVITSKDQAEDQLDNIYDSDFTQGSLSPTFYHASSWPSHSTTLHTPPPPNPSLYALIPHEMLISPTLPVDLLWHCPVGGGVCSYVIDLCSPSSTNLGSINAIIPQNEVIHLLEKNWKSNDEQVYMVFCEMVNAHWEDHLKELDIKYVRQGDTSTFEWIHPQRHASWPPKQWELMTTRRQQLLETSLKPHSPEV